MESGLIFPLLRGGVISLGTPTLETMFSSESGVKFGPEMTSTTFVQLMIRYMGKSDATGTGYIEAGEQDRSVASKPFTRRAYLIIPLTDAGFYSLSFLVPAGTCPAWRLQDDKTFGNIKVYMTVTPLTIVSN